MELAYSTVISPNDVDHRQAVVFRRWKVCAGLHQVRTRHRSRRTYVDSRLPCGHGRVCRMLRAFFADAQLTACNLDRDGVDFCAAHLSARPVYSQEDIRRVSLGQCFDLIWCGSLFTHLDAPQWPDFLDFFCRAFVARWVLVFTTLERQPIQWMRESFFDYGLSREEQRTLNRGIRQGRIRIRFAQQSGVPITTGRF